MLVVHALWLLLFLAIDSAQPNALPAQVYFVANEGQWEGDFLFKLSAGNATYFITETGMTIDLRESTPLHPPTGSGGRYDEAFPHNLWGNGKGEVKPVAVRGHVLKMKFVGANSMTLSPHSVGGLRGEDKLTHYSSYFLGNDSCKWRSRVSHYQRVIARDVWPGIDVEFVADEQGVKTNYHVQPYADPSQIVIEYEGLERPLAVNGSGDLVLATSLGDLKEKAPWGYQIENRRQQNKEISLRLLAETRYGFACEGIVTGKKLVIDPLVYGTFLGGSGYEGDMAGFAFDSENRLIVSGATVSSDFPTTPGVYQDSLRGGSDVYICAFTPDADSLYYSTYIGGNYHESPTAISIDNSNRIYVVGSVWPNFGWPLTPDAFDTIAAGGQGGGPGEGFIARLSSDGAVLEFSTYWGGNQDDIIEDCGIDSVGTLYVCGSTRSTDFPLTLNALYDQLMVWAGFLTSFDLESSSITYSTLFATGAPGSGLLSLTAESGNSVWVSGSGDPGCLEVTPDAFRPEYHGPWGYASFIAQIDVSEPSVIYASYLDSSGMSSCRLATIIDYTLLLYGRTNSPSFPMTEAGYDTAPPQNTNHRKAYMIGFQSPSILAFGTFLGPTSPLTGDVSSVGLALDVNGGFVLGGRTSSSSFPVTPDALRPEYEGEQAEGFLSRFSADLTSLTYSTYIGGFYHDQVEAVSSDRNGEIWIGGNTISDDFPVTPDAFQPWSPSVAGGDAFLMKWHFEDSTYAPDQTLRRTGDFQVSLFPNPTNSHSTVTFTIRDPSTVQIVLYDLLGRRVDSRSLSHLSPGLHHSVVDLSRYPSGSYWAKIQANGASVLSRVVLIK